MSGPRFIFVALLVVFGFHSSARAQDAGVPGGWDSQVDFQSFRAPGEGRMLGGFAVAGVGAWSMGGNLARGSAYYPTNFQAPPQMFNGLGFLGDTVRKSVRKRSKR